MQPSGNFQKLQQTGQSIKMIDVNFHLKKVWKVLITNQLTKCDSKMTRRYKYHPSCQLELRSDFWQSKHMLQKYYFDGGQKFMHVPYNKWSLEFILKYYISLF